MSTYYYIRAATMTGYGTTIYVGGCVPSPLLNEDIVRHTAAVRDEDLVTSIVDYGTPVRDRPVRIGLYAGTATVSSVKYAMHLFCRRHPVILGVCTSSATVGLSISFGVADAVVMFSKNPSKANAWAT